MSKPMNKPTPGHFKQRHIDALREVQDSVALQIRHLWSVHTDVQRAINNLELEQDNEAREWTDRLTEEPNE